MHSQRLKHKQLCAKNSLHCSFFSLLYSWRRRNPIHSSWMPDTEGKTPERSVSSLRKKTSTSNWCLRSENRSTNSTPTSMSFIPVQRMCLFLCKPARILRIRLTRTSLSLFTLIPPNRKEHREWRLLSSVPTGWRRTSMSRCARTR